MKGANACYRCGYPGHYARDAVVRAVVEALVVSLWPQDVLSGPHVLQESGGRTQFHKSVFCE